MNRKPVVALNADYRAQTKDGTAFTFVSAGYYDAVVHAGGIKLILPPVADEADLSEVLDIILCCYNKICFLTA